MQRYFDFRNFEFLRFPWERCKWAFAGLRMAERAPCVVDLVMSRRRLAFSEVQAAALMCVHRERASSSQASVEGVDLMGEKGPPPPPTSRGEAGAGDCGKDAGGWQDAQAGFERMLRGDDGGDLPPRERPAPHRTRARTTSDTARWWWLMPSTRARIPLLAREV